MSNGDLIKDGRYQIVNKLGKGSQGTVFLVEDLKTKEKKALKRITLNGYDMQYIFNNFVPEINYLFSFKHKNIVKYFEHFATNDFLFIVTEYCEGGDLHEYLENKRLKRKQQVLDWFYEIILGVHYLHNNNPPCIHRDLKPLNILIKNNELKVADFGLSRVMNSPGSRIISDVGTPPYMSPEIIRGENYGLGSDVWSLGVILYQMCMKMLPFRGDKEIKSKPTPELSEEFEDINKLFKE